MNGHGDMTPTELTFYAEEAATLDELKQWLRHPKDYVREGVAYGLSRIANDDQAGTAERDQAKGFLRQMMEQEKYPALQQTLLDLLDED